ncbi:hypothetical protein [Sphingobacterium sp.]|uniref:hypothetical protein n=1 Tax=Sphingobacterium sp. TaxID=341027 RepID=UPI0031D1C55B
MYSCFENNGQPKIVQSNPAADSFLQLARKVLFASTAVQGFAINKDAGLNLSTNLVIDGNLKIYTSKSTHFPKADRC